MPSLVWIALDAHLFSSDEGFYALDALRLRETWSEGLVATARAMSWIGPKPPLLGWTGQFLLPLGSVVGYDDALLLLPWIASVVGALALWDGLASYFDRRSALMATALLAFGPLFAWASRALYVQALQMAAVAWLVRVMLRSREWDNLRTSLHLVGAGCAALLTNFSSLAMCVLPVRGSRFTSRLAVIRPVFASRMQEIAGLMPSRSGPRRASANCQQRVVTGARLSR